MTPSSAFDLPTLARGIYTAPYRIRGCEALLAVTSAGELIGPVRVPEGADKDQASRCLDAFLDQIDAPLRPTLTLLRP